MSSAELVPLFFRGKKRRGLFSAVLCYDGLFLIQNLKQLVRRTVFSPRRNIYGGDCRAVSNHQLRMRRNQDILFRKVQPAGKHLDQNRVKCKRTAFKGYRRFDLKPLCQTSYGLFRNSMKGR